ncbi:MAG: hypothetical protein JOZ63_17050 [Planctomycetaceae bacterium]|nr:hypothetical protein [Planctomycetaceae bacterium]MBV8606210.1 hypothetical protein [Singulisphaera sp.]
MTIGMRAICDKCGDEVALVETSLLEVRSGRERTRKPIDLCQSCNRALLAWLGERTSGGGAS